MIERLGNVLYWIGCIGAVLCVASGGIMYFVMASTANPTDNASAPVIGLLLAACGLVPWLAGRALRYIFAGQ